MTETEKRRIRKQGFRDGIKLAIRHINAATAAELEDSEVARLLAELAETLNARASAELEGRR